VADRDCASENGIKYLFKFVAVVDQTRGAARCLRPTFMQTYWLQRRAMSDAKCERFVSRQAIMLLQDDIDSQIFRCASRSGRARLPHEKRALRAIFLYTVFYPHGTVFTRACDWKGGRVV
jgi:hypothetical protein